MSVKPDISYEESTFSREIIADVLGEALAELAEERPKDPIQTLVDKLRNARMKEIDEIQSEVIELPESDLRCEPEILIIKDEEEIEIKNEIGTQTEEQNTFEIETPETSDVLDIDDDDSSSEKSAELIIIDVRPRKVPYSKFSSN